MNGCSRCSELVPSDASDDGGSMSHKRCKSDAERINKVAEVLSKSLRIEIPLDAIELEDKVVDEAEKGLAVYASSSSPGSTSMSEDWSDEGCSEEGFTPNYLGSSKANTYADETTYLNLPSPSTVVSAMKGSREKQGIACSKLSVSWSPEVYDPVPTIVSHTVKNNKQKRHSKSDKKSGKGKHKGSKASKQSAAKDRKQPHKSSGSAKSCNTSLDVHDRMLSLDNQSVNFDVGSPEFFASSYPKPSILKVQMPATEAL